MDVRGFVDQVTGKSPAAAAVVLKQALTSPNVYFFAPLVTRPEIVALRSEAAYSSLIQAVEILMFGTVSDVDKAAPGVKDHFTPVVLTKLRQLTLVGLCSGKRRVTYSEIQSALRLTDVRETEDHVIDAITAELVTGRIDQHGRILEVHESEAREVRIDDIDALADTLRAFASRCTNVEASLRDSVAETKAIEAKAAAQRRQFAADEIRSLEQSCKAELDAKDQFGARELMGSFDRMERGGGGMDRMDFDRGDRHRRTSNR